MNGTKNLIMGLWARQPFRPLEKFIASLRRTAFVGDVCLCVADVSAETVALARAHGIIVERVGASAQPRMASPCSRYFSYLDYLTRHSDEYARVLLTEPRSAVFQSDPFAAPLPADIVYTQEHTRLGESGPDHDAVVQAHGKAVAHNMRDCMISSPDATIGTMSGMLRYLVAMTHELTGRTAPFSGQSDRGVHNYVVHGRPLRGAWLDPGAAFAAAMGDVPAASVRISAQGAVIDGRTPPVLLQWDGNATVRDHVRSAAHFRLEAPVAAAPSAAANDAVVAFYHRERDAAWLPLFLGSLRCVAGSIGVHCVGDFNADELALLARYHCRVHPAPASDLAIAQNIAHFYLSQALERLAAERADAPDQVLVLDSMRAVFPRDPFLGKTIGLSLFCEGPMRIGESGYNRDRLAIFVAPDEHRLQSPIVSSALARGKLPVVREFYRHLLAELVGRPGLLAIDKVVQGAFNKLCRDGNLAFPVTAHPNGAEAYFDYWPSGLAVDVRHGVRVGGTVPGVVLGSHTETELMLKLRIDLNITP